MATGLGGVAKTLIYGFDCYRMATSSFCPGSFIGIRFHQMQLVTEKLLNSKEDLRWRNNSSASDPSTVPKKLNGSVLNSQLLKTSEPEE